MSEAAKEEELVRIDAPELQDRVSAAFGHAGVPARDSELLAEIIVDADLRGVRTHGVQLVPLYIEKMRLGLINPNPDLRFLSEEGATAVFDGDNGLGHLAADYAMNRAIDLARRFGTGIVTARRTNHAGCMAFYPLLAASQDLIGFITTTAAQNMSPWGGLSPLLGNNPLAIAVPTGSQLQFVLDMATSTVSKGRVREAAANQQEVPPDWVMDERGRRLTQPEELAQALKGQVLLYPIGGAKGSGMAMMNAALSGVLAGIQNLGLSVPSLTKTFDQVTETGLFVQAIDIGFLLDLDQFLENMRLFVQTIKDSKPAPGQDEVFLPGELEQRAKTHNLKEGIEIRTDLLNELQTLAGGGTQ